MTEQSNVTHLEERLLDLNSPAVIIDGGVGTSARNRLAEHGIGLIKDIWSATAQVSGDVGLEILYNTYADFIKAGALVSTANTFRTQVHTFEQAGFSESEARQANRDAIEIALAARNDAGKPDVVVAFSAAPMDDCYNPTLRFSFDELLRMHYEQAEASVEAGAELMMCETLPTINEAKAALMAAQELGIKAIASFYCRDTDIEKGETGIWLPNPEEKESLEEAAYVAGEVGALAVATNCIKPTKGLEHVKFLASLHGFSLPFGTWTQGHDHGDREVDQGISVEGYPDHVVKHIRDSIRAGARIGGGCCDVTEHEIERMVAIADEEAALKRAA